MICPLLGWDAFLLFGFGGLAALSWGLSYGFLEAATTSLARRSLLRLQVSAFKASCGLCKLRGAEGPVWFRQCANGHCRLFPAKEKADWVMSVHKG